MRTPTGALLFALAGWLGCARSGHSAITYVDASIANTTLLTGVALVPGSNCTTGPDAGPMDNLWHLRTGVGNGNGVWTANEGVSGSEDVAPLVTTITFAQAGGYRLYAYLWDSEEPGEDWNARVRLGTNGLSSTIRASEVETANPARFSGSIITSEGTRRLVELPLGVVVVAAGGTTQVCIDDSGSRCTWYDGVGYEKVFGSLGERVIAIDFNKTNSPVAPSQAMFRIVGGSSTLSQNSTNIFKQAGPYGVQLNKESGANFDFRGANGDSSRSIPGGPTSLSFLVSDFIGGHDGIIRIGLSNLVAGTYLFRSYHLDTYTGAGSLGFAAGASYTTPNTLRAHVGGSLQAIAQPTCLGALGLATTWISDTDIPTLSFPFLADGTNQVVIALSTLYTNGVDRSIFLNGFEVFSTVP